MSGKALVCKLHNISPIEGADRIVRADLFNETVITGINNVEGTIGLLFDCDTQLTPEYAAANNMFRHSELNSDKTVVGYMDDNARVRPIKLKGVKCTALFMPLDTLEFIGGNVNDLSIGEQIDEFCGVRICNKYVTPETTKRLSQQQGVAYKKKRVPTFHEHFSTDQLQRNLHLIKEGSSIVVTEKLHGTSSRCGYLSVDVADDVPKWFKWISRMLGKIVGIDTSIYQEDSFVVGSRTVVKSIGDKTVKGESYYKEDIWTESAKRNFENKLHHGETVYYEIVGDLPNGSHIMPGHSSSKLEKFLDKEEYKNFVKTYGEHVLFSYGCKPSEYDIYVYRITMTNQDGVSIDLSWEQVKQRCQQLGVKHVPEIISGIVDNHEAMIKILNVLRDSPSETFPDTVKEGICVRIDNGGFTPIILKDKTYVFKVLENIIKDLPSEDMEEAN